MNDGNVTRFLRFLSGAWPTPTLDSNQVEVWSEVLARCEADLANDALMMLMTGGGREWSGRPTVEEFFEAYRGQLRRKHDEAGPPPIAASDRIVPFSEGVKIMYRAFLAAEAKKALRNPAPKGTVGHAVRQWMEAKIAEGSTS